MARVSSHVASRRRRGKVLKLAKGYWGNRSRALKTARETVERALVYSYRGRKERKRDFRRLWIARINAATRQHGISYSVFINALNKSGIRLNRKVLADIAVHDSETFKVIVSRIMSEN